MTRRRIVGRLLAAALAGGGLLLVLQGGWIPAKAALAQALLRHAWARTLEDGQAHRPWPWADHWPVARLRVERLGIDQIVLRGDSGAALAFGPGLNPRSALPGRHGTVMISGHRDTHFAFLRQAATGDVVELSTGDSRRRYRLDATRVVDARTTRMAMTSADDRLYLVTCYPFDAIDSSGPWRFVAMASPVAAGDGAGNLVGSEQ